MDAFYTVLRLFLNQKATIGYSFLAILTIGGELIFSMVSFECPCNRTQNFSYGITFLLGPALVLLVLGFFFSARMWRLFTGCCLNPRKLCPRGNCLRCTGILLKVTWGACIAPVMWLCVALLNGTFYECAISGLDDNLVVDHFCQNKTLRCWAELARVPCQRSKLPEDESKELLLMFRAQSQVLGWCINCLRYNVGGLLRTVPVSYVQLKFWQVYAQKESDLLDRYAAEHAQNLAERNLTSIFLQKPPEVFVTPDRNAWEKVSSFFHFSTKKQHYSVLHKYVETDLGPTGARRPSGVSEGGDLAIPTVLSFVDDGRAIL
ncbi:hypothetical protein COCON_G00009830 [Conger conger]|uniref:Uncharacterized protein n=1 Tax=Conger conger TaxID=82655 RepID=A0A9Q1E2X8_CONCO|nr:hypothetical protein COCON_G00009830 [Conger conger]